MTKTQSFEENIKELETIMFVSGILMFASEICWTEKKSPSFLPGYLLWGLAFINL